MEIETLRLKEVKPYKNNPRKNDEAVALVKSSIVQCGYCAPIVVDENNEILAGHTRYKAVKELGWDTVQVVKKINMTEEQKKKYRILDNKTGEFAKWDYDILKEELNDLDFLDMHLDFFPEENIHERLKFAYEQGEKDEEYEAFEEKFKPKLTTDDCYTPQETYDAVKNWAVEEYKWHGRFVVRPFFPGGDYKTHKYPENCVVIDNPPFSIISKIVRFYESKKIDYFLFAPHLTMFGITEATSRIVSCSDITYENGAVVKTGFVCSVGPTVKVSHSLHLAIEKAETKRKQENKKELPKYTYPSELITASRLANCAKYGPDISFNACHFARKLDKQEGGIYGGGFLISELKAAELKAAELKAAELKAAELKAAELKAAEVFELSDREKEIVKALSENENEQ